MSTINRNIIKKEAAKVAGNILRIDLRINTLSRVKIISFPFFIILIKQFLNYQPKNQVLCVKQCFFCVKRKLLKKKPAETPKRIPASAINTPLPQIYDLYSVMNCLSTNQNPLHVWCFIVNLIDNIFFFLVHETNILIPESNKGKVV